MPLGLHHLLQALDLNKGFILYCCYQERIMLSPTTDNKDLMQLEISLKHFYKLSQFKLVHMLGLRQGKADAKKQ